MQLSTRAGILIVGLAGAVFAQSMIEHAAVIGPASVGATTGAAAGFKLSQALKGVADAAAANGVVTPAVAPAPAASAAKIEHNVAPPPSFFSGDSTGQPTAAAVLSAGRRDMPTPPDAAVASSTTDPLTLVKPLTPVVAPVELTKDQLLAEAANLQNGVTREQTLTKLGAPAYKISFDEEGSFMERCRFRASGEDLVVVEFKDGLVSSVKVLAAL